MKNTLFIVDDHSMLKNGLKNYLETNTDYVVTGTFADGTECLAELQKRLLKKAAGIEDPANIIPDMIIVDIQLANEESGFVLVQELKSKCPQIKIVMYSMFDTWGFVLQAKDLGVQGYISKVASDEELVAAITPEDIESPTVQSVSGSKTATTSNATGVGCQLNFTDTAIWGTLKANLGEDKTKKNRIFAVLLDEGFEVPVTNGYEEKSVMVYPIEFKADEDPIVRGEK